MAIIRRSCLGLLGAGAITVGLVLPASAAPGPAYNDHYSGYVTPAGHYTDAGSVWAVPTLNCLNLPPFPYFGISGATQWVGLGGVNGVKGALYGGLNDTPLVQDGIISQCVAFRQVNTPFWEVVPGNLAQNFKGDKVEPGDLIYASVAYLGGGKYVMSLGDVNKAHGWRTHVYYTDRDKREATTAEWIIEPGAPAFPEYGVKYYSLSDFYKVTFYDSSYSTDTQHGVFLGGTGSVSPVKFIQGSSRNPEVSVSPVNSGGQFTVNFLAKRHIK